MSNHDKNSEFDDYLSTDSNLSKLYRSLNSDIINPKLDASILNAAKQQLKPKPRFFRDSIQWFFSNKFLLPFSTAASVIIISSIVSYFPVQQQFEPSLVSDKDKYTPLQLSQQKLGKNVSDKKKFASAKPVLRSEQKKKPLADFAMQEMEIIPTTSEINSYEDAKEKLATNKNTAKRKTHHSSPEKSITSLESRKIIQDNKLIYDKKTWHTLSSNEWLKRIKMIYFQQGRQQTIIVIRHFNKRFPNLKINLQKLESTWK